MILYFGMFLSILIGILIHVLLFVYYYPLFDDRTNKEKILAYLFALFDPSRGILEKVAVGLILVGVFLVLYSS